MIPENEEVKIEDLNLQTSRISRLNYILNYSLSTSTLYILSYFYGLLFILVTIAAIIFTPYLIITLYNEKKTGWLITFFVMVMFPVVLGATLFTSLFVMFVWPISLGFFYFYCFLLKLQARDWVEDESERNRRNLQLIQSKLEEDAFNRRYMK